MPDFILIVLLICLSAAQTVQDYRPGFFKSSPPEGFWAIETGSETEGQVLCLGDINGDRYTDYVALPSQSSLKIYIYLWDGEKYLFKRNQVSVSSSSALIKEAILGDFDQDGSNQLLVILKNVNTSKYQVQLMDLFCRGLVCSSDKVQIKNSSYLMGLDQPPFITDFRGTGIISLFCFKQNQRYTATIQGEISDFSSWLLDSDTGEDFNVVDKHFASQVDFTGDCHSDLVIVSQKSPGKSVIQFYAKASSSNLGLVKQISLEHKISQLLFSDMDQDGDLDVLYTYNMNSQKILKMVYNTNGVKEICIGTHQFPYNFINSVQISLPQKLAEDAIIHLGDVNIDGYPDIVSIFQQGSFRKSVLLINNGKMNFENPTFPHPLQEIKNPSQIVFYDFSQDGKLDIMVFSEENSQNGEKYLTRTSIINNLQEDSFFIKILPLSPFSAYETDSPRISSSFGVTVQWVITNLDGSKKIQMGQQMYQFNYGALQLPTISTGLGRTNNYVEDLTVGYSGYSQKHSWSPIIPNSQLLVYRSQSINDWKLQMLLSTNARQVFLIVFSLIFLIVFGIVILFLGYREGLQDKKDHYNFIQLIR